MPVNIWGTVGGVTGFLPLTALTGAAGQLLGMNAAATAAEWKALTYNTATNQLAGPAGTAAAPLYAFTGTLNTGAYLESATSYAISVGGARRARFTTTGNVIAFNIPAQMILGVFQEDFSADIVAAATTDLATATGNFARITNAAGVVAISSFGGDTIPAGTCFELPIVIAGGTVTLIYDANKIDIATAANLPLANGDIIRLRKTNDASPFWKLVSFQRGVNTSGITAKGDLITGKSSGGQIIPGIQSLGTQGQVLTVNTTDDDGLIWTPYASASGNAIHCGDFSTNPWQRGTTFAAIANAAYSADRWQYNKVGAAVHTVSKDATSLPSVALAGKLVTACLLVDCTTANAAPAAGDFVSVSHKIEGANFIPLAQGAMAFQFLSCHTLPGIYCVGFRNSGSDRSYVIEYTQAIADTWQVNTVIIPASPAAGTWNYTTGVGLEVVFTLAAGATFQTPANIWTVGNFFATANQVNATNNVLNNFRIALPDLRPGSVIQPVQSRDFQDELNKALRYCEVWGGDVVGQVFVDGLPLNTLTMQGVYKFKVPMRIPPALALSAVGDFTLTNVAGTAVPNAISTSTPGRLNTAIFGTSAGAWTAVNQQTYIFANSINARVIFSADL